MESLLSQLSNLSQGPLRDLINKKLKQFIARTDERECAVYTEKIPDLDSLPLGNILSFRESEIGGIVNDFIASDLLNPASPIYLNRILQWTPLVVDGIGKFNIFEGHEIVYNDVSFGKANIAVDEFKMPNLGAFENGAAIRELVLIDNTDFSSPCMKLLLGDYRWGGTVPEL